MLTLSKHLFPHPTRAKRLLLDAKLLLPFLEFSITLLLFCLVTLFDDIAPLITESESLGKFRLHEGSSRLGGLHSLEGNIWRRSLDGLNSDVGLECRKVDNSLLYSLSDDEIWGRATQETQVARIF